VNGDDGAGRAYFPNIVSAVSSVNSTQEHGFASSDIDEPESWPLFNYGTAGNKGAQILRGVPLRDGIFCEMSDGTIQVISGSAPPFRVDELDSTAKLIGPDTAAVLNNQIWAHTTEGQEHEPQSHGATLTDKDGKFRLEMPQIIPVFGQPHGHLAYDSGEFKTVFLRPVMRNAKETSLEAHFVLQPA
jgi:hypothetical protein